MSQINRRIFIFALSITIFALGYGLMRRPSMRQTFFQICDLVEDKFYQRDQVLDKWVDVCRAKARRMSPFGAPEELLTQVQDLMDLMHVSHFMVYSPVEDRKLWKGQSVETGLRARWMEEHPIIYQVLPGSPARAAGFRIGDEVLAIDGKKLGRVDLVASRSGVYEVLRMHNKLSIPLRAAPIAIDAEPTITALNQDVALIDLSSFRSEYFDDKRWKAFVKKWSPYRRVIVDLRENPGGNFVAMLRSLSPIFCQPTVLGRIVQPRLKNGESPLINDLSDENQIDQLDRTATILLKTYAGYGCYQGDVAVLVGPHTSSVAEIFSAAVSQRPRKSQRRTRVFGQPTAGDVILAIWYDLPGLGEGYSISIPQAVFLTIDGHNLEGEGVFPQQEVFDDLDVWRTGVDSWIRAAARAKF